MLFFSRSATRMTFQLFFIDSHATRSAWFARSHKRRMIDVRVCVWTAVLSSIDGFCKEGFTNPDNISHALTISDGANYHWRGTHSLVPFNDPKIAASIRRAWIEACLLSLFWKYFTTFLNVKVHDAPSEWNERKKKFLSSFSRRFFARLQFYMQCTLSINYLTLARFFYYISNVYAFIYALPQL